MFKIYQKGQIVFCKSGRDKGKFLIIAKVCNNLIYLLDGKRRYVGNAKAKNPKHVSLTKSSVDENVLASNREIRRVLSSFNDDENVN